MAGEKLAELHYGKQCDRMVLEIVVPHGTKIRDLTKLDHIFKDIIGKLPRGCGSCLSGEPLNIRERLEHVIRIDLDKMQVVG